MTISPQQKNILGTPAPVALMATEKLTGIIKLLGIEAYAPFIAVAALANYIVPYLFSPTSG